jgi:hypothetical protein
MNLETWNALSETQRDLEVAKACGAEIHSEHLMEGQDDGRYYECARCKIHYSWRIRAKNETPRGPCPGRDYIGDLEAMRELELALDDAQYERYGKALCDLADLEGTSDTDRARLMCSASAERRALAYVVMKGLENA